MNKIFKLKHGSNGTKVVSEIARNSSKATDKRSKFASFALATALLSPLAVSPAFAKPWDEGNKNDVTGSYSNASGQENKVSGSYSFASGQFNTVSKDYSFASGKYNTASGPYSTVVGDLNEASGLNSVSLGGRNNHSTSHGSATLGGEKNNAGAEYSATVGGYENTAIGRSAVAWGNSTFAGSMSADATWLKQKYNPNGTLSLTDTIKAACDDLLNGWNSCRRKTSLEDVITMYNEEYSTAADPTPFQTNYGKGVSGKGENATSWGLETFAGNNQATAFGENSIANGENSTAFGKDSYAYADNSLAALGGKVGDINTAKNTHHSDTGKNSVAIGENAWVKSDNAFALGKEALVEKDSNYAIAFGQQAESYATNNISIGSEAKTGKSKAGTDNIAIGTKANANNTADKTNGIAIGNSASANEENTVSMGFNAQTTLKDSVALGSNTTTKDGVKVKDASVGGIKFETFAGELANTNEVVSVGGGDVGTRQIQNVASGQISKNSTDAINGSQLYAAYDQLQWQVGINNNSLGTVGKLSANNNKSNVNFIAGDGIEIISQNINNGYGIKYNVKVDNDTIKIDSNGNLYADIKSTGGGSGGNNTQAKLTVNNGNEVSVSTPKTSGNIILEGKNLNTNKPIYDVSLNKDVKLDKGSITITGGKTVSISGDKVDMGGNRIQNVAPGVKPTDAVNVSQLKQSLGDIHNHINEAEDRTNAGISGAMAMAGLPQPIMPGKGMLSAAAGYYEEEGALAIGLSKVSDNGKWVLKTSASINTESKVGANVGIGFQW